MNQGNSRGGPPHNESLRPGPPAHLGPDWGLDDALPAVTGPSTSPGNALPVPRVSRLHNVGHTRRCASDTLCYPCPRIPR